MVAVFVACLFTDALNRDCSLFSLRSLAYINTTYCSTIYSAETTPQILILGLAGGQMHNFLLRYFPCMEVTSVDIDSGVLCLLVIPGVCFHVCIEFLFIVVLLCCCVVLVFAV